MIDFSRPTALFGGSFDPIHAGHLHIAENVRRLCPGIEQIVFVPAAHSPGKGATLATAADRLRWVKLAAEPENFQVWDVELMRAGESYTVDTLRAAHSAGATADRLFWLMGADAYRGFPGWKTPGEIRSLARLLVVNRPGLALPSQNPADRILEIPPHPASSTNIRAELARCQENVAYLPEPVRQDLSRLTLLGKNPYAK